VRAGIVSVTNVGADAAAGDDLTRGAVDGDDAAGAGGGDVGTGAVGGKVESEGSGADGDGGDLCVSFDIENPGVAGGGANAPDFRTSWVSAKAGRASADGDGCNGGEFDEVDDGDGAVGGVGDVGLETEAGAEVGREPLDGGEPKTDEEEAGEENDEAVVEVGFHRGLSG